MGILAVDICGMAFKNGCLFRMAAPAANPTAEQAYLAIPWSCPNHSTKMPNHALDHEQTYKKRITNQCPEKKKHFKY